MEMTKRYLNEKEFEAQYGIRRTTLRRWRVFGKGPRFRKLHGAVRYDVRDIESWIESCPTGGNGQRVGL